MEVQGSRLATDRRFALVVSRFNGEISEGLLRGAREALADAGVNDSDLTIVHVPGAFEIPLTARHLAASGRYDAVICLGCVIKGETMHFEYIASAVSQAIMSVSIETGVPVTFGVLTTLTEEQAVERAGHGSSNKGREAAVAAIEMTVLLRQLDEDTERDG